MEELVTRIDDVIQSLLDMREKYGNIQVLGVRNGEREIPGVDVEVDAAKLHRSYLTGSTYLDEFVEEDPDVILILV